MEEKKIKNIINVYVRFVDLVHLVFFLGFSFAVEEILFKIWGIFSLAIFILGLYLMNKKEYREEYRENPNYIIVPKHLWIALGTLVVSLVYFVANYQDIFDWKIFLIPVNILLIISILTVFAAVEYLKRKQTR